ncbi:bacteriohemerythrin [Desulfovibrio sp. Fe33]|uniref:bacteriohemerythrin n=1 Tax=Desulfovibrio sp. Fe33 TaxID=3020842 RepID=UPI00234D6192|nr:bacteriohemerythrin [Desulfovibrio sp. Fe33]
MRTDNHRLDWYESLSVGVPSIDEQHKRLIALTDKLFQAIMDDVGKTVMGDVLNELADYTTYHFGHEEQLLLEHGYPEDLFAEHQYEHQVLTTKVHELIGEHERNASCLDLTVYEFLRDWTTEHMKGTDSQYSDFLIKRGVR